MPPERSSRPGEERSGGEERRARDVLSEDSSGHPAETVSQDPVPPPPEQSPPPSEESSSGETGGTGEE